MRKLMSIAVLLPALAFGAGEYTWVGNASSSWTNSVSYTLGGVTPSDPPPADATVILPANARATIDDDSIGYVASLRRLQVVSGAEITIDLTVSNAVLGCAIVGTSTSSPYGRVVKTGSRNLTLASVGRVVNSKGTDYYDYFTSFEVREGGVVFPQDASGLSGKNENTGTLAVSNNAVIALPNNAATYATKICGDGTISNSATSSKTLRVSGSGIVSDFGGKLTGAKLALDVYYGTVRLTGVENDFTGAVSVNGESAVLGAAKFGKTTDAASSIGTVGTIYVKDRGGMIRCLNTVADETDKVFSFYNPTKNLSADNTGFDAGAFGGVTFSGNWVLYDNSSSPARMRWIILTGSNTVNACTMAGDLPIEAGYDDNVPYTFTITKRGKGVWKFAGSKTFAGAVNVDDGVFQFDSLNEKGYASALGKATMLYEEFNGAKDERTVDYAMRLGDGGAGTEGTLEYVGNGFAGAKDRPIAMKGDGRLRHSGTNGFVRLSGVTALTAGAKTLTLDGDAVDGNAADCEIANIADAADRSISIVKEGTGCWALTGNQNIRGTIRVKGGTLYLRNPVNYTWFRWTLKEPVTAVNGNYRVYEFGLFDASSNRVNTAMTVPNVYASPRGNLQYGEAAFTNSVKSHNQTGPLVNMFDGNGNTYWRSNYTSVTFNADDESKWIPIVMHVSAATPVCSFDFNPYYSNESGDIYAPKIFSLEGSADGANWHEIASEGGASVSSTGWYYKRSQGAYRAIDTSVPMAERATAFLQNVESVRVDSGATLKMEGDVTLSDLVVDAAGGTIVGGALASDGTIDVLVDPDAVRTAISFINVDGVENLADWTLKVNGEENDNYSLSVSSGGTVTLVKKMGMLLILR